MSRYFSIAILLTALFLTSLNLNGQTIPQSFRSEREIKEFLSQQPQFQSQTTGNIVTFSYSTGQGLNIFVNQKHLGRCDVSYNSSYPRSGLIGVPWIYGDAPLFIHLNNGNPKLELIPIEGEENISLDSRGQVRYGLTGNRCWMALTLDKDGVSFRPCDNKPLSEFFIFLGFNSQKLLTNKERKEKERKETEAQNQRLVERQIKDRESRFSDLLNKRILESTEISFEDDVKKNPLLKYISEFTVDVDKLFSYTANAPCGPYSNMIEIEVIVNSKVRQLYENFWKGMSPFLERGTLKIKPEYQSTNIKSAFDVLLRKIENLIFSDIYISNKFSELSFTVSRFSIREEIVNTTVFGSENDTKDMRGSLIREIGEFRMDSKYKDLLVESNKKIEKMFDEKVNATSTTKVAKMKYDIDIINRTYKKIHRSAYLEEVGKEERKIKDINLIVKNVERNEGNEFKQFCKSNNLDMSSGILYSHNAFFIQSPNEGTVYKIQAYMYEILFNKVLYWQKGKKHCDVTDGSKARQRN